MISEAKLQDKFALVYDPKTFRRVIAGMEVVIHCHHYSARIQNSLESSKQVDGKKIILTTAESVFAEYLANILKSIRNLEEKWQIAAELYAHLGYGQLDLEKIHEGIVTARTSHFVEGWLTGFTERKQPVCTFTEGYLQGAIYAITGEIVAVREEICMLADASVCRFVIERNRTEPFTHYPKKPCFFTPSTATNSVEMTTIDTQKIINTVVEMPIYGNKRGLIPAFGVYLANIPADFLNLLSIHFVEEMRKKRLFNVARRLLIDNAETCAINTFSGFSNSPEWKKLVAPMIKVPQDKLHAIIAMSNALGWGNLRVIEHTPEKSLTLESLNGYEALGIKQYRNSAENPRCFMLTGFAAGVMALIYHKDPTKERFGTYISEENRCIACGEKTCLFTLTKA